MPVIAFFDYDDTLSCGDSILYWNCFLFEQRPDLRKHRWVVYLGIVLWCCKIISTHTLKRLQLKATSFLTPEERSQLAHQFVTTVLPQYLFPEMVARMHSHRQQGHRVVVVSASADFYMNQDLLSLIVPCDEVVGTSMEFPEQGLLRIPKYTTENFKGPNKVTMLQSMDQFPQEAKGCYAYSDHYSDRFLLEYAEYGQAVNPDRELEQLAIERGWPIWRPYRAKNGKARSLGKLKMLVWAGEREHNRVPSGIAWRSQQLNIWMDSWKSWILGTGSWQEFWFHSQTLKGLPLELALEEVWLRRHQAHLPLIPTAQYLQADPIGDLQAAPLEILPYCTWKRLHPSLVIDEYTEVKVPVRGVREMMGLDRRFIQLVLDNAPLMNLDNSPFFEARLERISQLLKRDYQADKEFQWYQSLLTKELPRELELGSFKKLEGAQEVALLRIPHPGIHLGHQVEGGVIQPEALGEFVQLMISCLAVEVVPQVRFGQVWRYIDGSWLALDPNAMTPAVAGAGRSFVQWLSKTQDLDLPCFEGIDLSHLKKLFPERESHEILEYILSPIFTQSVDSWAFYQESSTELLEETLGELNSFTFDLAMNLVELRELRSLV